MVDRSAITLDEFKARLPIADVVGRHVRLTRRGRDLWGCCPFHHEKTASFHVVPDKGFYHCFGCGQHGNAIDFVMAVEGVDFAQALQRLAELTGVPAPRLGGEGKARVDQTLYAANQAAARWFAGPSRDSRRRPGGRVSAPARPRPGDHRALRPRLRAGRAHGAQAGHARRRLSRGAPARGRSAGPAGRRWRELRPLPRPGDVSDPGSARPRGRVRRPCARGGARQVPEHAGDACLPQGRAVVRPAARPGGDPRAAYGDRRRRLHGRDRAGPGRLRPCRGAARHRDRRSAARPAVAAGR